MKKTNIFAALILGGSLCPLPAMAQAEEEDNHIPSGYSLVWADEFDIDGKPNPDDWGYEYGFVRNHEHQWYQEDNAYIEDGILTIEGRKERFKNPKYDEYTDWRKREYVDYTSACITTDKKHSWLYGIFLIKAKIPPYVGCWPAIWTMGQNYEGMYEWPYNGEIDIMEFYQIGGKSNILANFCWGGGTGDRWSTQWASKTKLYDEFLKEDPEWGEKFHVWKMVWNETSCALYIDNKLMNRVNLYSTVNTVGSWFKEANYNPFKQPHFLLLNLALGGDNGGSLGSTPFPAKYQIDYVRVYQKDVATAMDLPENADGVDVVAADGGVSIVGGQSGTEADVCVFDLSGSMLWEGLLAVDGGSVNVPVNLSSGFYIVKVISSGGSVTTRRVLIG